MATATAVRRSDAKRALNKIVAHNREEGHKPFYIPAELRESKQTDTLVAYFTQWLRERVEDDGVFRGSSVDALRDLVDGDDVEAGELYRLRAQLMDLVTDEGLVVDVPDEYAAYRVLVETPFEIQPDPPAGRFDELHELIESVGNENESLRAELGRTRQELEDVYAVLGKIGELVASVSPEA